MDSSHLEKRLATCNASSIPSLEWNLQGCCQWRLSTCLDAMASVGCTAARREQRKKQSPIPLCTNGAEPVLPPGAPSSAGLSYIGKGACESVARILYPRTSRESTVRAILGRLRAHESGAYGIPRVSISDQSRRLRHAGMRM